MIIFVFVTLLIWVNEQFLQGNVPSCHLLNEGTVYVLTEMLPSKKYVNDCALKLENIL